MVGFMIRQEHPCSPGEGRQGVGWQLESAAAPEGMSLAPAQQCLHCNR